MKTVKNALSFGRRLSAGSVSEEASLLGGETEEETAGESGQEGGDTADRRVSLVSGQSGKPLHWSLF